MASIPLAARPREFAVRIAQALLLIIAAASSAKAAVNCQAIGRVAALQASSAATGPSTLRATGKDRVQFHQAPSDDCPLAGVFILPGETVTAHRAYKGFTAVTYTNPESQKQTSGWVQSDRLAP